MAAAWITVVSIAFAFALAVLLFAEVAQNGGRQIGWTAHQWLLVAEFDLRVGIFMDALTAVMLIVVTGVSLLVQVYSMGYMKGRSRLRAVLRLHVLLHRVHGGASS